MKTFAEFLLEAGQEAGKMELGRTSVEKAYEYAQQLYAKKGHDLDKELPNFKKNYVLAQKRAATGRTVRKDMPVIDAKDVKRFQRSLEDGKIDLSRPYSKETNDKNPFPEGLSGDHAKKWLELGLKRHDGSGKDDKVNVKEAKIEAGKLKPIQKQIYFDKSVEDQAKFGVKASKDFLTNQSFFIVSADNYIIDGHHRMLSAMLLDPNLKVQVLMIDLPIKKLLPVSLAFGDAVGNKRNL